MLRLRQYFCKHDYRHIAAHRSTSQNLWQCDKCAVFYIQHWQIGVGYKTRHPNINGWIIKGHEKSNVTCGR